MTDNDDDGPAWRGRLNVADLLRDCMEQDGVTVTELSRRLGIEPRTGTVSGWLHSRTAISIDRFTEVLELGLHRRLLLVAPPIEADGDTPIDPAELPEDVRALLAQRGDKVTLSDLLLLTEARASVALDRDPDMQTHCLPEAVASVELDQDPAGAYTAKVSRTGYGSLAEHMPADSLDPNAERAPVDAAAALLRTITGQEPAIVVYAAGAVGVPAELLTELLRAAAPYLPPRAES